MLLKFSIFLLCISIQVAESTPIYGVFISERIGLEGKSLNGYFFKISGTGSCKLSLESSRLDLLSDLFGFETLSSNKELSYRFKKNNNDIKDGTLTATIKVSCTSAQGESTTIKETFLILDDESTVKPYCSIEYGYYPFIVSGNEYTFYYRVYEGDCTCKYSSVALGLEHVGVSGYNYKPLSKASYSDQVVKFNLQCTDDNYPEFVINEILTINLLRKTAPTPIKVYLKQKIFFNGRIFLVRNAHSSRVLTCKYTNQNSNLGTVRGGTPRQINGYSNAYYYVEPFNPDVSNSYTLDFECSQNGQSQSFPILLNTRQAAVIGDPHFSQFIYDSRRKSRQLLCYDVSGKSGQFIQIFTIHNFENIEILGKLLDDYYMHSIKIKNLNGTLNINTTGLFYKNQLLSLWNAGKERLLFSNFQIFSNQNYMTFKSVTKNSFTIFVTKSENALKQKYLNINIYYEKIKKSDQGGLIGDIANKEYQIFDKVQNNNALFMSINGKLRSGEHKSNEVVGDCLLFNVNDLIFPKSISEFVFDRKFT